MINDAAYPDRLIEWLFASMMLLWGGALLHHGAVQDRQVRLLFVAFEAISCWRSAADGFHSRAFRLGRRLHA